MYLVGFCPFLLILVDFGLAIPSELAIPSKLAMSRHSPPVTEVTPHNKKMLSRESVGQQNNKTDSITNICLPIWDLGGSRWVGNTPTGCGNHFHTSRHIFEKRCFVGEISS